MKSDISTSSLVCAVVNDKWDIMADLTRTGWSAFNELKVVRDDGSTLTSTPENWKNTWRASLGINHHYNEHWISRAGLAYDQSPVLKAYRTPRVLDSDRTWLALGGQYKPDSVSALDFGYAHLFVSDAPIDQDVSASGAGTLTGNYKSDVNILSVQYTHNF